MATETENLVLEHLRAIRAQLDDLSRGLGELRGRVSSIEHQLATIDRHLANMQGDIAMIHQRLDDQGVRLDRIERRLELSSVPCVGGSARDPTTACWFPVLQGASLLLGSRADDCQGPSPSRPVADFGSSGPARARPSRLDGAPPSPQPRARVSSFGRCNGPRRRSGRSERAPGASGSFRGQKRSAALLGRFWAFREALGALGGMCSAHGRERSAPATWTCVRCKARTWC